MSIFTGGVPLIYGSQEVGTSSNIPFFSNSAINWDSNPEMLDAYRKILQYYSSSQVARVGHNTVFQHQDVACFKKSTSNAEIVIMVNLRNSAISYTLPSALQNTTWTNAINQNNISLKEEITLAPYQFYILN